MSVGEWNLFIILFFSAVGLGYFIYGKRQRSGPSLIAGLGLMIYPYFISNAWGLIGLGLLFMAIPFAARRFGI